MCGITGYWNLRADESAEAMQARITPMANSMFLRGPDSGGAWISPGVGLALGHRRLAIVDLSPAGHQPMSTADGRYTICYNGEVYDSSPLRQELMEMGVVFRGTSDTEALLYGCAILGIEATISRLTGMFAFAFWDSREKVLTLVRDRLGVKPLYWAKFDSLILFGSELKPLVAHPGWPQEINRDAIAGLVDLCYIPAPISIYKEVYKLRPGHLLEFRQDGSVHDRCWWEPLDILLEGKANQLKAGEEELVDQLDALLRDAIQSRMVADVPIGAFLSGGVDSSTVAALMQAQSDRPIRTFSIGFEEKEYNEAPFAKAVAEHLGTDHTEEYMSPAQVWEAMPQIAEFYDEPFADSSQLPTYLLSLITRKQVTTALSGDGGDELFCGYGRYFHFLDNFKKASRPAWQNRLICWLDKTFTEEQLEKMVGILPARTRPAFFGRRIKDYARRLSAGEVQTYRNNYMRHWSEPLALVPGSKMPELLYLDRDLAKIINDPAMCMQFQDVVNYMPDDILVKVDRASMAVSLEARVPLLDHRVFAFTWQLPPEMRLRNGVGKWILRQVLYRYVPQNLIDRPKMGFGVPIDHWLRGPMRNWCESLLDPARLRSEGYFNHEMVSAIWKRHLDGENYQYWIWDVLMFQAWLESHKNAKPSDHVIETIISE